MTDVFSVCAQRVCERFKERLPDLSGAVVLLPDLLHIGDLPRPFLEHARRLGHEAIIPPPVSTPRRLATERIQLHTPSLVLTHKARHFTLGDALVKHRKLFKDINRWQLSESLLTLFDELSLREEIIDTELLGDEPRMLIEMHRAWLAYLSGDTTDETGAYREQLDKDTLTRPDEHVFLCGFDRLLPREAAWAKRLEQSGRLTRIDFEPEQTPVHTALAACFDESPNPHTPPPDTKPLHDRLRVFTPGNLEEHAQGIALTVQHWLEDDVAPIAPIAIVTQNRRLARRVNAVLKSRNITLHDRSGWAFSTSSSATAVHHLLDDNTPDKLLLKLARTSRITWPDDIDETAAENIELALIKHGKRTGLPATSWPELEACFSDGDDKTPLRCMQFVRDAMRPIESVVGASRASYGDFFAALFETMEALGMTANLRNDRVGASLMKLLAEMRKVAANEQGDWIAWRAYISHMFETGNFIAGGGRGKVSLMNFRQAQLTRPRGVILASLDTRHAEPTRSPLLTELGVRELGMDPRDELMRRHRTLCRRLIEGADQALLTCEADDEQTQALPWFETLRDLHEFGADESPTDPPTPLTDKDLLQEARLAVRAARAPATDIAPLEMPAPPGDGAKPLKKLSPAAVQIALDCPYKYFARYGLGLYSEDSPPDGRIDAAHFGSKVHQCMAALMRDEKGLPGPFTQDWTDENRDAAHALGEQIVRSAFGDALGVSYVNRHQQHRALLFVRRYINWLIDDTAIADRDKLLVEYGYENRETIPGLTLSGRVDLAVFGKDGAHIIDYKTGNIPSAKRIDAGDDIQLNFYALCEPEAHFASYLTLDKHLTLNEEDDFYPLERLTELLAHLIQEFKADYESGEPMPARGRQQTCQYCDYIGLCRKPMWYRPAAPPASKQEQ